MLPLQAKLTFLIIAVSTLGNGDEGGNFLFNTCIWSSIHKNGQQLHLIFILSLVEGVWLISFIF